jgi:hypothetical protein
MSANRLALALRGPSGRITSILHGRRALTGETSTMRVTTIGLDIAKNVFSGARRRRAGTGSVEEALVARQDAHVLRQPAGRAGCRHSATMRG